MSAAIPLALTPAQTLYLDDLQRRLAEAQHGTKAPLIERAAIELDVSVGTVQRWLSATQLRTTGRRQRSDAGVRGVSTEELEKIAAALLGTYRKTGRRIMSFDTAVDMLRANGEIVTTLSASRLATVLMERGMHPSQLIRPEPAIEQRSLHPNHVWQFDASVCVAYYLSNATGLQVMDEKKFYKNKPANVTRVQAERLIRYACADHYTHEVFVRYYLGSECAASLADFVIWACAPKDGHPVHGVMYIAQMDMGSANTSRPVLNLLERLQVRVIIHERHNSRANGSVEKAHHIVETQFESALRFARVRDLDDLNEKALQWSHHFGATKVHTRYNRTRHALWMTITPEQLRIAPPVDVMQRLVHTQPVKRRVDNNLEITFALRHHGRQRYDVRYVPGVMAGAWVPVVMSPYALPAIEVGYVDADTGETAWMQIAPIDVGADGKRANAPVIGQDLRQAPRGELERARDAVRIAGWGGTADEAAAAQEAGALVFGGRVNPWATTEQADLPAYLPKRGTALDAPARTVEAQRLTTVEACKRLRTAMGAAYTPEVYGWVASRWPDGVPEDQINAIAAQFAPREQSAPAAGLRVVGGGQ